MCAFVAASKLCFSLNPSLSCSHHSATSEIRAVVMRADWVLWNMYDRENKMYALQKKSSNSNSSSSSNNKNWVTWYLCVTITHIFSTVCIYSFRSSSRFVSFGAHKTREKNHPQNESNMQFGKWYFLGFAEWCVEHTKAVRAVPVPAKSHHQR